MEQACLGLWAQVVLQAKADVEQEPFGSLLYNHAVSFFVGSGEWAQSRAVVGECLDIPEERLRSSGQQWIAARRAREGLPPEPPPPPPPAHPTVRAPLPLLTARPGPDPRDRRNRRALGRMAGSPFNPFRLKPAMQPVRPGSLDL
jgi:hypothetical protein